MKFISHLDMNRCMARLIAKSAIPIWYTEGFNQRIYTNFAVPLSLGYEGYYEILDIRLTEEDYPLQDCLLALQKAAPPDIEFVSVAEPVFPMKTIAYARYELTFEHPDNLFWENLTAFLHQDSVLCQKVGKKGRIKEIDLIPKIKEFSVEGNTLSLVVAAGCDDSLNPGLVLSAFFEQTGTVPIDYTTKRTMIYNHEMEAFR